MKKISIIISLFIILGCAISKTGQREVLTYYELTKEQRKVNGKIVKEKYLVKKRTDIKHGKYEKYDLNYLTIEQGNYENGERIGVWTIWNKKDEIWIEKDFSNDGIENPIIKKGYLNYPIVLVENRDTLPIGLLVMKLDFDEKCQLNKLEVLQGIDTEFDKHISKKYKRYARLCYKYNLPIEECIQKRDILKINFSN